MVHWASESWNDVKPLPIVKSWRKLLDFKLLFNGGRLMTTWQKNVTMNLKTMKFSLC